MTDTQPAHIGELLGIEEIETDAERGYFKGRYQGTPAMSNGRNIMQGGMLGAMLDNAMARAAMARMGQGRHVMSLEMKVSFMAPAPLSLIIGEGWVVKMGRSIAFLEARLVGEDGTILATATSTARVTGE
jgi:uncharacterized protein (TIGR00369 family)